MSDYSEKDLPWIGPGRYGQSDKSDQTETLIYRGQCNLEQEIVDEFVRMRALETCPGRTCSRVCPRPCRAQCYSTDMAGYCSAILCLVIVSCLLFLTFFSILYIVPRVAPTLERTTGCTVVRFDYQHFEKTADGECGCHIRCDAGPQYTDYCVHLGVEYTDGDGQQAVRTLGTKETAVQCTPGHYPHCPGDVYVDSYSFYMTVGSTFLCLSHPDLHITDTFDLLSVTHICWPVGVILISIIWLTCIGCTCGWKYVSVQEYPPHVKTIADGLGKKGIFTIVNLSKVDRARIVREWRTVCVRMVSDEEENLQRSEQTGAAAPEVRHHHEAVPTVQVHQQPAQVHQVQVSPEPPTAFKSAREVEEEEEENNEHHTLEYQHEQHLSQKQVSDEDLSSEDAGVKGEYFV